METLVSRLAIYKSFGDLPLAQTKRDCTSVQSLILLAIYSYPAI